MEKAHGSTRHAAKAATGCKNEGPRTKVLRGVPASFNRLAQSFGGMYTQKPRLKELATARDARTRSSSEVLRPSKHNRRRSDLILATGEERMIW